MRIAALLCALLPLAPLFAQAQPPPSALTRQEAARGGRVGDASVLERAIEAGDAALVAEFGYAMGSARIEVLPAAVEKLVVRHFNHPMVGERLRGMQLRYRTRELFDLFRARCEKAFKLNEPCFERLPQTDQGGIEESLLGLSGKLPTPYGAGGYLAYVARRGHPAAIGPVLAALESSFGDPNLRPGQNNWTLELLLAYPDPELWKRVAAELDRLHSGGRVSAEHHAAARRRVDAHIAKGAEAAREVRWRRAAETYFRRIYEFEVNNGAMAELRVRDPARHAAEMERWLTFKESLARELGEDALARTLAWETRDVGLVMRFRVRDPARSLPYFEKAARLGDELARIALADAYQLGLNDRAAAIRAYRSALAEARQPRLPPAQSIYDAPGSLVNTWWQAWFRNEIAYLETGKPFRGTVGEPEVGGFFLAMLEKATGVTGVFAPEFFQPNSRNMRSGTGGMGPSNSWQAMKYEVERMDRPTLGARLEALPASHLALMMALRHASALADPEALLRFVERHDPGGYWGVCLFGTVAYLDGLGPQGREEALRNESAELLPGMAAPENPTGLSQAATLFMARRGFAAKPRMGRTP